MKLDTTRFALVMLLALATSLAGCGKKSETPAAGGASSDSMLAASPAEQPQGQLQPQSQVTPEPAAQQEAPAPAPAKPAAKAPAAAPAKKPAPHPAAPKPSAPAEAPGPVVAAGTNIEVTMGTYLTSETATEGSAWTATLKNPVMSGSTEVFPAGSTVTGVVAGVKPAAKGERAFMLLRVTSITANGVAHPVMASIDSMIAGSTTKRNVGAIAGGAAAGAIIGRAIGGSGKGAVIGGLLGGAAAGAGVAASKGFQVEVVLGKPLTFHVDHDTKIKR